jgi:endoglucanase
MSKRRLLASLIGLMAIGAAVAIATGGAVRARAASPSSCGSRYPAKRDPSNPLMLRTAPGADPLTGANFFVDGPAHGVAASAIAQLLGINTKYSDDFSWARFKVTVSRQLQSHRSLTHEVTELEKIADAPEPQRFSSFSRGGGPGAIYAQVVKVLCNNLTADPGSIPIISTYFLHASLKGCPSSGQIYSYMPTFKRRINEMVSATGNIPVVYLLELDSIGSSYCIYKHGSLPAWEAALRYEINKVSSLPHAVVYVEGGYSDSDTPKYNAMILNAIGIRKIRGFFTNDTHINWTINELKFDEKISKLTHGSNFVIDTADNGNGPKLNPHPGRQGIEDLCNPPDRALGPQTNTSTGYKHADGFLWTHIPGVSSGCGGGPPGGVFWLPKAVGEAERANNRLGPHFPSRPY